ncbi:MAG: M24 family metallopeptidase [Solirubrobacterales bacterium]
MSAREQRVARLREAMATDELDALLVTEPTNIRYLSGFTGTNGLCLLTAEGGRFFTDFRYTERAEAEVQAFELADAARDLVPKAVEGLTGRIGFDDDEFTVSRHRKLTERIEDGAELIAAGGMVEALRRRKDAAELEVIAAAAEIADQAYRWAFEQGLKGRTEREVAVAAVRRMVELGADGPSFPPIVATGPNGALPHAEPGDRIIAPGDLVVFDMGASAGGYASDCTRTVAIGEPAGRGREMYELVQAAQQAGLDAVAAGAEGADVDAAARAVIDEAGHGDAFGHGVGHGVGMEVHEAPRLAPTATDTLQAGDVVTIEPGIYLRGELGVRIEDLVAITAEGPRNLSSLPKDLLEVD